MTPDPNHSPFSRPVSNRRTAKIVIEEKPTVVTVTWLGEGMPVTTADVIWVLVFGGCGGYVLQSVFAGLGIGLVMLLRHFFTSKPVSRIAAVDLVKGTITLTRASRYSSSRDVWPIANFQAVGLVEDELDEEAQRCVGLLIQNEKADTVIELFGEGAFSLKLRACGPSGSLWDRAVSTYYAPADVIVPPHSDVERAVAALARATGLDRVDLTRVRGVQPLASQGVTASGSQPRGA